MQLNKMNPQKLLGLALAALFILSACRAPAAQEPTQDINALYTQVAGTLIAQGQAPNEQSAATNTPLVTTATASPSAPTASPTNTTAPATNTPAAVCNQAAFVTDVTIKDGTQMGKGEDFTKTWRLKNTGTCTWDKDYTVVFSSGTNLANKSSYDLPGDVSPVETVDISIPMEAPDEKGTFTSNWVIRSDTGATFGVNGSGGSAGVPFFVVIKVGTGSGSGGSGYDFAANYCDADWESHSKNNLPCPGANQGDDGFVIVLANPELENGVKESEPAIWMQPSHEGSGWIRGVFPNYTVKEDDHFVATIGCLDNNPNCRVTFTLSYIKENDDEVQLGSWDEKFDNQIRGIDIDLSSLAGKQINIVLTVDTGNNSFAQANAFWLAPVIENQ